MALAERIAACECGKVRFMALGEPIASAVCYCASCQAGGRQIEAAGARPDFRDEWGGSPYAIYRDDRMTCLEGASLVRGFKLSDAAPSTRFVATCCNSAMCLKFGPGWWTSVYRVRFGDAAPLLEWRNQAEAVADRAALPDDLPVYSKYPPRLFWRLIRARIGSWLRN
jgi:hypothetical protein